MKILINYADNGYYMAQKRNATTAIESGKFDEVWTKNRGSLGRDFIEKNKEIMMQTRGAGYWLWKPCILNDSLRKLNDSDYLFYCDSGSAFINPIDEVIDINKEELNNRGVVMFKTTMWVESGPPWSDAPEYMWTKRDTFSSLGADSLSVTHTAQANAATILLKKTDFSLKFISDWLNYCEDPHLMTDSPSLLQNFDGFKEHRHDQSLLSVLGKARGVKICDDITHWGEGRRSTTPCKTVIYHDRYKG